MRPGLRRSLTRAAAAVVGLLATGCQPPTTPRDRLPPTVLVGDYLRFYGEAGEDPLCGGTLTYMDRYLHGLIELHDVSPDLVVDYYWFPSDPERIAEVCSRGTACTFADGLTITSLAPHEHELVHAVRREFGYSQGFIEEGAAEVWGAHDDRSFDYRLGVEAGIELAAGDLPIAHYGVAGRFAAFVMYELGTDAFVEIGRNAAWKSSPDEVDQAFESVVGVTASELAERYETKDWNCSRALYRDDSISCASARQMDCDLADADGTLSMVLDLDCASEAFVGPRGGVIWSDFVVPVSGAEVVGVTITLDRAKIEDLEFGGLGSFSLRPCAVGCEDSDSLWPLIPNFEYALDLSENDYLFRIEIPTDVQPRGEAIVTIRNACAR
jgi:hypothetical protein